MRLITGPRERLKMRGFCTGPEDGAPPIGSIDSGLRAPCGTCGKRVRITARGRFTHHKPPTWWAPTVFAHKAADAACGRPWSCACGACRASTMMSCVTHDARGLNAPTRAIAVNSLGSAANAAATTT